MAFEAFGFGFYLQALPSLLLLQYLQGRTCMRYQDSISDADGYNVNDFGVVSDQKHDNIS